MLQSISSALLVICGLVGLVLWPVPATAQGIARSNLVGIGTDQPGGAVSRPGSQVFLVDGANSTNRQGRTIVLAPIVDEIEEFRFL